MIIRSQDGKITTDELKFEIIHKESWTPDIWDIKDFCGRLFGTYSTEEKAIKVLDMMCNFANKKYREEVMPEYCGVIGGIIFCMPSDEEVDA